MKMTNFDQRAELGKLPWGATRPAVYLCGSCRAVEIDEGVGLCRTCVEIAERRDADGPQVTPFTTNLTIVLAVFAVISAVLAWATGVKW